MDFHKVCKHIRACLLPNLPRFRNLRDMETRTIPGKTYDFDLADRLRKARLEAGLSREDMSDLGVCSAASAHNYETRKTRPITAIARAWAEATGSDYEWLMTGTVTREYQTVRPPYLELVAA